MTKETETAPERIWHTREVAATLIEPDAARTIPYVREDTRTPDSRLATREDADAFIQKHLDSAQWEGESLMVSFERESLIHALVEDWTFEMDTRTGSPAVWDFQRGYEQAREDAVKAVDERANKMDGMFSEKLNEVVGAFAGVVTNDICALAPPPATTPADLSAETPNESEENTMTTELRNEDDFTHYFNATARLSKRVVALTERWNARNILLLEVSGRGGMLTKEHVNPDALDGLVAVQNEFDRLRNIVIRDLQTEVAALTRERDSLREACKKALTCATLNSDVRALIDAALATPEENQDEV